MSSSYNLSFFNKSNFILYTFRSTTLLRITWQWFEWSVNCTFTNQKRKWFKILTSFGLSMRHSDPGQVHSQHHTYIKVMPLNMENNICGTICMQSHSPRSWDWLVAEWHKNSLASDLLKEIWMTTSMSNVVRSQVCRATHPRSRLYYMVQQRFTKIPSWEKYVSTTGPTWWLTWVFITLWIMIGSLAIPGYSMPRSRIGGHTSWED